MQVELPARKQVVEADPNRDAAIEARHVDQWLDDLATVGIGPIGAREDHQLGLVDCCRVLQLRVDLRAEKAEREWTVEQQSECQGIEEERCETATDEPSQ